MDELTIVGYVRQHFLMIYDILYSLNETPKINLFDNQNRCNELMLDDNFFIQKIDSLINKENLVLCLSNPNGKFNMINEFKLNSKDFINCIHTSSSISRYINLKNGIRIEPMVCIANNTTIEDYVNISRSSSVGHDCYISKYSTLNPSVSMAGGVYVGERTQIGIGSTIINNIRIGNNVIIGAGSVVTKNIPDNVIAYGNPCKIIKENV